MYDTDHTKIYNPCIKRMNTHTQVTDLALSVRRVKRYGALRSGWRRMFRGRSWFRLEFTETWLTADGRRGQPGCFLMRGCLSWVGYHSITVILEGWLTRAQERRGNVRPTWRDCDSSLTWTVSTTSTLLLLPDVSDRASGTSLQDASDRGREARRCRVLAIATF